MLIIYCRVKVSYLGDGTRQCEVSPKGETHTSIPATEREQRPFGTGGIRKASWRESEDLEEYSGKNRITQAAGRAVYPVEGRARVWK